jgi:hypothetical protein
MTLCLFPDSVTYQLHTLFYMMIVNDVLEGIWNGRSLLKRFELDD